MNSLMQSPGLIGGIVGLAFGVVDWLVYTQILEPKLEQAQRQNARGGGQTASSLPLVRWTLLFSCFVAFPVVGWFVGQAVLPAAGFGAGG